MVLKCQGPLQVEATEPLGEQIERSLSNGQRMLVFDLSETPFVDSAGLESLLQWQEALEKVGGVIKLASVGAILHDALRITRLSERFDSYPSAKAAAGSFAK